MLFAPCVRFHIFSSVRVVAAYWRIAAHSAYDMLSWYKCHFSFLPPLGL